MKLKLGGTIKAGTLLLRPYNTPGVFDFYFISDVLYLDGSTYDGWDDNFTFHEIYNISKNRYEQHSSEVLVEDFEEVVKV